MTKIKKEVARKDEEIIDCCAIAYAEVAKEVNLFRKKVVLKSYDMKHNEAFYPKPRDLVSVVNVFTSHLPLPIVSFDVAHSKRVKMPYCYLLYVLYLLKRENRNDGLQKAT